MLEPHSFILVAFTIVVLFAVLIDRSTIMARVHDYSQNFTSEWKPFGLQVSNVEQSLKKLDEHEEKEIAVKVLKEEPSAASDEPKHIPTEESEE